MGVCSSKTSPLDDGENIGAYAPTSRKFHKTYALSQELGSGAYSVVKLGVHKVTGQETAVKICQKRNISASEMECTRQEIELLHDTDHPNIIQLFEVYDETNEFYIVTELVAGGELFERIVAKEHYNEKEARDLVKTFLEAMKYLHDRGIVHRDIKPENLLLRNKHDDSDVLVADFGFAKRVKDITKDEGPCGTPNYIAPEMLRGDQYGCEADIWSMGVVCYILLAGYTPFFEEDQRKLFDKIKKGKYSFHPDYWDSISPEAVDLIRKMMCVDQKERWTADQLLAHPWITAGDETLASKDISKTIKELKRYNARKKLRAAANAVILSNRMGRMMGMKPVWMVRQEQEEEAAKSASNDDAGDDFQGGNPDADDATEIGSIASTSREK